MPTIPLDVVGPGAVVALGLGLGVGVVWYLAVIAVEAVVLWLMRWAGFWRSLLASLLMNTFTTLVGFVLLGAIIVSSGWLALLVVGIITWLLSVVLEWGVMALMDRTKLRRALAASLVANIVTYLGLMVFYVLYTALVS